MNYSFNIIENLGGFFSQATPEVKIKLLGSIFPDKIEYDGKKYRTKSYNKMLDVIFQETKHLEGRKKRKSPKIKGDFSPVPTDVLFSNQMLEDLDKIWALRDIIPDPNVIETDQQNTP